LILTLSVISFACIKTLKTFPYPFLQENPHAPLFPGGAGSLFAFHMNALQAK
jgi:hypothetical protein